MDGVTWTKMLKWMVSTLTPVVGRVDPDNRILLIVDGHASRLDVTGIDTAHEYGIDVLIMHSLIAAVGPDLQHIPGQVPQAVPGGGEGGSPVPDQPVHVH